MSSASPIIVLIAAMARNRCIGTNGTLPWHLPEDLKHFKALTTDRPIIMGRKTWESIGSKPLPNRMNIVVTSGSMPDTASTMFVSSLEQAIAQAAMTKTPEIMIIGGGQIYRAALPFAHRVYLTEIDTEVAGDAYFPELSPEWHETIADGPHTDHKSGLTYVFKTYDKAH